MKYCKRFKVDYINNKVNTSVHIVHENDVEQCHGKAFKETWLMFIKNKPVFNYNNKKYYYYDDYAFAARQTNCYLNAGS